MVSADRSGNTGAADPHSSSSILPPDRQATETPTKPKKKQTTTTKKSTTNKNPWPDMQIDPYAITEFFFFLSLSLSLSVSLSMTVYFPPNRNASLPNGSVPISIDIARFYRIRALAQLPSFLGFFFRLIVPWNLVASSKGPT